MSEAGEELWMAHVALWASHLEPLAWAFTQTEGPVFEYGVGWYSTPVLHGLCQGAERELWSYEADDAWVEGMKQLWESESHHFNAPTYVRPNLVFIDDAAWDRAAHIREHQAAKLVVVHDTEPEGAAGYPFMQAALDEYEYRRDYTHMRAHTTIVSNFVIL